MIFIEFQDSFPSFFDVLILAARELYHGLPLHIPKSSAFLFVLY